MLSDGRAMGYTVLDAAFAPSDRPGEIAVEILVSQAAEPDLVVVERLREQLLSQIARGDVTSLHVIAREVPRTELLLLARDVPNHGGRVFFIRSLEEPADTSSLGPRRGVATRPLADAGADWLTVEPLALENSHLRVEVDAADGTLTLRDKRTGRVYVGLNQLEDSGDVGDLYNWSPPAADETISAPLWPPDVTIAASGPARAALHIRRVYALPAATAHDRQARDGERVICETASEVSLVPGARRVEIRTTVQNTARDHRLRAVFPLPFVADSAAAEGVFEVARRPAQLPGSAPGEWSPQISAEQPVNTFPQKRFVDLSDGVAGLAILNRGLPEYEVLPPNDARDGSAVAITLLRCVEWLSRDDLATRRGHAGPPLHTPEAQGIGTHTFEYALAPHSGDWSSEDALVLREASAFEAPLRAVTSLQHDGPLGSRWSAVYVTPTSVQVSAIKHPTEGDGLVVRLHNPLDQEVDAEVILNQPFSAIEVVNLAEDRIRPADTARLARILSTGVRCHLRGGEIQTLRFGGIGASQ
jgi:mannosylglycerate hydrolase